MIESQREILEQGRSFLRRVSPRLYVEVLRPQFMSSSGAHMRHILDHYRALILAAEDHIIDYDARDRGGSVETSPRAALETIDELDAWLRCLDPVRCQTPRVLRTEVSVSSRSVQEVPTTLARELVFAASHAVHHYAMIGQISMRQGLILDTAFGLAPSTATHLRESTCAR